MSDGSVRDDFSVAGPERVDERLEHDLQLASLINQESLANLLEQFGTFLHIGFAAASSNGVLLCATANRIRLCESMGPAAGSTGPCPACSVSVPRLEPAEGKTRLLLCPYGVSCLLFRVDNQFEPVGYLMVGPFATGAKPDLDTSAIGPTRADQVAAAIRDLPVIDGKRAHAVGQLLCTVLEEVVFANYQSYLFSKMHLQLSRENLSDVTGNKDASYDQTLLESEELRSLF